MFYLKVIFATRGIVSVNKVKCQMHNLVRFDELYILRAEVEAKQLICKNIEVTEVTADYYK